MVTNNQEINELLDRYVNKTISESDFTLLFDYINKAENKQILIDYMKQSDKNIIPDAGAHEVDWGHMYHHIIDQTEEQNKPNWIISFGKKLAVAASLIILGYLGYQFYADHQIATSVNTAIAQGDVAPGGDKAILKLADGTELMLNDAQNGTLTTQGSADVNKSDEGFIEYNSTDQSDGKVYTNVLSTPRGGQYRLMLPDKTLVWLNAESSITFPTAFIGNERKVKVTGEAYFEVSKDKKKTFIVESENAKVEVLGTHFNVMNYLNEQNATVTLLEGAVKLSNNGASTVIIPGQQAIFNNETNQITLKNVDIDNVVDWKNGLFIFENTSLQEVMRQVERWYDVNVQYVGKIPDVKFNAVMSRNQNVSKLIKYLQAASNVNFTIKDRTIAVKQLDK